MFISPPASASSNYAAILVNAADGEILYAAEADTKRYPASLTKIMTLYLVFEKLKAGDITMDTKWKVSKRATRQPPSKLYLKVGQKLKVQDAILSLVTKSANDVATTIAENMAGSESRFARLMTQKSKKLGMKKTVFRNASGLPHRGQKTTARDMAMLSIALMRDFPEFYKFFSQYEFNYGGKTYYNHNKLLTSYDGTDGIKTGYINASGYNLVASTKRDGQRLVGVVFGGKTSGSRDRHMKQILDRGFTMMAENAKKKLRYYAGGDESVPQNIGTQVATAEQNITTQDILNEWRNKSRTTVAAVETEKSALPEQATFLPEVERNMDDIVSVDALPEIDVPTFAVVTERPAPSPVNYNKNVVEMGSRDDPYFRPKVRKTKTVWGTPPSVIDNKKRILASYNPETDVIADVKTLTKSWGIQVGAYTEYGQAKAKARQVSGILSQKLDGAKIAVTKTKKGRKLYYRSRLVGIEKADAKRACSYLSRKRQDCIPVFIGNDFSVASLQK
ncbi:MAG: D-alanyl-D-alanine carboxypeptidase family protein [Alphaproteobacteria bacterium]